MWTSIRRVFTCALLSAVFACALYGWWRRGEFDLLFTPVLGLTSLFGTLLMPAIWFGYYNRQSDARGSRALLEVALPIISVTATAYIVDVVLLVRWAFFL